MNQLRVPAAVIALTLAAISCNAAANEADRHVSQGEEAFKDGRYTEALAEFEQALEGDLESHEPEYVHYMIGRSHDALDQFDEAIAAYQRALEINPDYEEAWVGLGVVYRLSGDFEAAHAAYSEALAIDPDNANAHSSLGTLYLLEDNPEESIKEFEEAIRLDPQLAAAHGNLALAYAMVGRFDEADESLRRATALGYTNSAEIQQRIDALQALEE
jgi:tetratricopeptide (TPR) repeat protein